MENYIGRKLISAKPMTRGEHSKSKGFKEVLNGSPEDEGYQVIYEDGYESWSPKKTFEESYKNNGNLTIGDIVEFGINRGLMCRRLSWEIDRFIFRQVPATIDVRNVVPKMQSLPDSVKAEFAVRHNVQLALAGDDSVDYSQINYTEQIANVDQNNNISNYTPTVSDLLANDWYIVPSEMNH